MATVHLSFQTAGACYVNCQNGLYHAQQLKKKKMPKSIINTQSKHLCGHLQTLYANVELLQDLFPFYFGTNDIETDDTTSEYGQAAGPHNVDDSHICQSEVITKTATVSY